MPFVVSDEICNNDVDDDGDGLVDCGDLDCILNDTSLVKNNNTCFDISDELEDELMAILDENTLVDPCTPHRSSEEIVMDALSNCTSNCGTDEFYSNLNLDDYIMLGNSLTENQKMNCVWENFISSDNSIMCSTLANFYGDSKRNLNIYVQKLNGQNGTTNYIETSDNIYISIDEQYIEDACIAEIVKTLLHEGIHAEIELRMKSYVSFDVLRSMFPNMMYYFDNASPNQWQHEFMAIEYFDELVLSLKDFFGEEYNTEEYETLVWYGLSNTEAFNLNSGMTPSELQGKIDIIRSKCDKLCD